MDQLSAADFIQVARALSRVGHEHGLVVPSFRSPPRADGVDRAIRRWPGGAMVAVRRTEMPLPWVLEAMVQGLLLSGPVEPGKAAALRPALAAAAWKAVGRNPPSTEVAA